MDYESEITLISRNSPTAFFLNPDMRLWLADLQGILPHPICNSQKPLNLSVRKNKTAFPFVSISFCLGSRIHQVTLEYNLRNKFSYQRHLVFDTGLVKSYSIRKHLP